MTLPPLAVEVLRRFLGGQQKAEDVEVELRVEELFGDLVERREGIDAGVVDQNVELAEGLLGFGEEAGDVGLLRYVALHGDGFAALGGDGGDDLAPRPLAGRIVDDDGRALSCERLCDLRANAL